MNEVELSNSITGIKVRVIVRDFSDDLSAATYRLKGPPLHEAIDSLCEKLRYDLSLSFINEKEEG